MKLTGLLTGALALSLVGTGCATKKYVAKTVAPVEQRVSGTETKNGEQDKEIASQGTQIQELDGDLSRTKEKLGDTDNKATQAGEAAKAADQKATTAQQSADGARTFAEQGLNRMDQSMQAMNNFQMVKSEAVLFAFNSDKLTPEGKTQLDDFASQAKGMSRFVVEVQGFTDKSGSPTFNETLSEARAQSVSRYLVNQYQIPIRNISMLGSGYAMPVADDETRDGRKMNRRVEVRLWVPENQANKSVAAGGGEQ